MMITTIFKISLFFFFRCSTLLSSEWMNYWGVLRLVCHSTSTCTLFPQDQTIELSLIKCYVLIFRSLLARFTTWKVNYWHLWLRVLIGKRTIHLCYLVTGHSAIRKWMLLSNTKDNDKDEDEDKVIKKLKTDVT